MLGSGRRCLIIGVFIVMNAGGVDAQELSDASSVQPIAQKDPDPWIRLNRGLWSFNDRLDRWVLMPIARGYTTIAPDLAEEGVSNFFDNLQVPGVALNQILQGKPGLGLSDMARFACNSTLGVLGVFDVATRLNLPQHNEDFGQTLNAWGVPQGPYVVIPLRGPATVTHASGMIVDVFTNPITYIEDSRTRNLSYAMHFIDLRKRLLGAEVLISGDEYLFVRDVYLQRRDFLVRDGVFEDDPFMDFEDFE